LQLDLSAAKNYTVIMKNTTELNNYYDNVISAAKTLEEYYERMAKFTSTPDRIKEYNALRLEMKNLWRTHESYSQTAYEVQA
jgi:hypothetical protein